MAAPSTNEEFLELVRKSGVVDEKRLDTHMKGLRAGGNLPPEPGKLAGILVRDGILTHFQAEQFLLGKWRRFTIGKYKVLERLGSGGMGSVYLCEHKFMRRRAAVKVLPQAKAEDPAALERFYREARAVAALDHPNIVRAYDIDQEEKLHFLVMEYVDGSSMQEIIKKFGPMDVTRTAHYIRQAAIGLEHAHQTAGLVHRVIKPGNLLVDRTGTVKILDMGLARFFHDTEDDLTKKFDENVLGTADYLAPEQALDSHSVDIRADIYSLGATFYYLLTGSPLFPEGTVPQKLIWHQNRQPRPVQSLRPEVPDALVAILEKMMMKDLANRYQTPSEVMVALASWVVTPIPPPSDREMPTISPAAGGTRAPTTMVGGTGRGNGPTPPDVPTVISPNTGARSFPRPAAGQLAATPPPLPVWESLDAETQPLAIGDTDRTATDRPRRPPAAQPPGKQLWLFAGLALLLLAILIGVYFAFFNKSKSTLNDSGAAGRRIVVSKVGGENAVATLGEALAKAGPGDRIVLAEPRLTEPALRLDWQKHKDLTIESEIAGGKPAVVEAAGAPGVMLDATSVEGFHLKNVEFDGRGKADVGVQVSGVAAGTVIEGVTVRSMKSAAFKLSNAAGAAGKPVLLDRCRAVLTDANQTGFLIRAANADTHSATVRNSRVE